MKVILEAFQGKLRSEPIDWPEETGPEIHMLMDLDPFPKYPEPFSGLAPSISEPSETRIGRFVYTGFAYPLSGAPAPLARVYRLVGLR